MFLVSLPSPSHRLFREGGGDVSFWGCVCLWGGGLGVSFCAGWGAVGAGVHGRELGGERGEVQRRSPGVAAFCYLPGKITARVRLSSRSVLPVGGGGVRDIFIIIFFFFGRVPSPPPPAPCFPVVAISSSNVVQMLCTWGFFPHPHLICCSPFCKCERVWRGLMFCISIKM